MINFPLVSIVLTTKNEEKNIANCLQSVKKQKYPCDKIELIVVDNFSSDKTTEIAKRFTNKVYSKGPQRAAQLNFGVQQAKGKYILYPDADMILSENIISECIEKSESEHYDALYIPEEIVGDGFWIAVRNFERSFYNGTCIDAVRFVKKERFLEVDGFDENIDFGADDWDFNRRIKEAGKVGMLKAPLYHNEGKFSIRRYTKKKGRYSKTLNRYIEKWGRDDPEIRKQFGVKYRLFGVFVESQKWRVLLTHPTKAFGMYFLRFMVGITYLKSNTRKASDK